MKTKITLMIAAFAIGAVIAQIETPTETPDPNEVSSSLALVAGKDGFTRWTPSSPDFEFDAENSSIPEGVSVSKIGNDIYIHAIAGDAGVQYATITVVRKQSPHASWAGPKITHRDTYILEIIRFRGTIASFFDGRRYIIMESLDQTQ